MKGTRFERVTSSNAKSTPTTGPAAMGAKRRRSPEQSTSNKKQRSTARSEVASNTIIAPTTRNADQARTTAASSGDVQSDEETPGQTLQVTDDELVEAQHRSKWTQKLLRDGVYKNQKVELLYGLAVIHTSRGRRVLLPPSMWAVVFKELHGSVWSGHLRETHTHYRVAQIYWWPGLRRGVRRWVRGCQECGSRKARPRQVIPPLRSIRGGDVGDRWALDVAGPFPVAEGGERYVVAAVEYVTRYAVATSVREHTAESIAEFIMKEIVLRFGVFRELLTDKAPEMTGRVIELLVEMLQARQVNPVPYRPQFIGLVERFNRTWKDCVATLMQEEQQNDWELYVRFAVYAYNSARHTTVALSPNELMLGRKLRMPNELLRRTGVTEAGDYSSMRKGWSV